MTALKPCLVALILVAGLSGSAKAQGFVGGYGYGYNPGYYTGFNNFGGGFNNFGGVGPYTGYGNQGTYFMPGYTPARTYNNMDGLIGTITRQTGRPGSYRYNSNYGVSRARRNR